MKVLVIDDDPAVLDLVVHFLGLATHHNVNAAPSATIAPKTVSEADKPNGSFFPQRQRNTGGRRRPPGSDHPANNTSASISLVHSSGSIAELSVTGDVHKSVLATKRLEHQAR